MTTVGRAVLEIVTDQKGLDSGLNSNLSSIKKFSISATGALSSIGVGLSAAAVVSGVKSIVTSVLEYGGEIEDLSTKMGVSMDATQRWKYAAEQTGASLETVSKSVVKLSDNLDGGGKSVRAALATAGLEFNTIRAMKPEDAFNAVFAAIAKIPDHMTQVNVGTALMGKGFADLIPAMRSGFDDLKKSATVMSDETVKRLAAAGDAWDSLGNTVIIVSGEILAGTASLVSQMKQSWTQFFQFAQVAATQGLGAAIQLASNLDLAAGSAARSQKDLADAFTKTLDAQIKSRLESGQTAAEIAKLHGVTVEYVLEVQKAAKATAQLTPEQLAAAAAAKKHADEIQALADKFTGKALAREVADLAAGFAKASKEGKINAFEYAALGKQLDDLKAKGAVLPPELQAIWLAHEKLNPSIKTTTKDYGALAAAMKLTASIPLTLPPPPLNILPPPGTDVFGIVKQIEMSLAMAGKDPNIKLAAQPVGTGIGSAIKAGLSAGLANLGNVILGAIQGGGNVGQAAFASIGGSLGASLGTSITTSLTKSLGKGLGGAIGGLMGPLGTLAGASIGKLFDGLFGTAGRDAVKVFAANMGGFSALQKKLQLSLSADEAERLWKNLTQGVGKNNPQQAAAAIKAIEDALARAEQEAADLRDEIARVTSEVGDLEAEYADLEARSKPAVEDMEAAAKRLGIEISQLGPIFAQQQLTAQATEVWDAFDTLIRGGTDFGVVLSGSTDELNKLVQDAMKAGLTIPSNFKPILQSMIDQGLLLDDNGNKITDLSQLKFGDPVKSQWEIIELAMKGIKDAIDKLNLALDALIKKLGVGVVDAAEDARDAIEDIPAPGGGSSGGRSGGGPTPGGPSSGTPASFGFSSFGGATFAMPRVRMPAAAGFGGFATAGMSSAFTSNSQRPIIIQHTTNLDGKKVAKNQAKYMPGEGLRAIGGVA